MPTKKTVVRPSATEVAKQVEGFIDKFDPAMGKRIREVCVALRKRFPTAIEMVYDNYNFFVIGYSPTIRPTDYIVSLAANAKGVGLSFNHGADLPDPHGILQGSGSQNRFVRLESAKTLKDPHVAGASDAAVAIAEELPKEGGYTVVRSISAKQRPRR
jgi:hypothetical protein